MYLPIEFGNNLKKRQQKCYKNTKYAETIFLFIMIAIVSNIVDDTLCTQYSEWAF